jgi:5-methylcytosine-specific restriction endonuclease McrA
MSGKGGGPLVPCGTCGAPTTSVIGYCQRTYACKQAGKKARYNLQVGAAQACELCGHALRRDNVSGICGSTSECRRERAKRAYVAGIEAEWARGARYREVNREGIRAKARKRAVTAAASMRKATRRYVQRPDRPCRYAKAGCADFAMVGQRACSGHHYADQLRYEQRRKARIREKLANAQGGTCLWCDVLLPEDLSATHVDHIIPVSHGGPDVAWNWQLLHDRCNLAKGSQVTREARELAEAKGVRLALDSGDRVA